VSCRQELASALRNGPSDARELLDEGTRRHCHVGDQWRVVALHGGSTYASEVDYQGKDTAYVNYGIQIQATLADLRATATVAAAAIAEGQ
jgi:hypothetical protein